MRLSMPRLSNLRTHPYEFADLTSKIGWHRLRSTEYIVFRAQPNTFTIDEATVKMRETTRSN
jgi:hypothetical protein